MNTKLLRQKILDLAIRGKLTEQKKSDGTTKDLLKQIAANVILSNAKNPGKSKNTPKEIIPLDKSEAPFEIPENWEWVRLGDLCSSVSSGKTPSTIQKELWDGDVLWVTSKDVKQKYIQSTQVRLSVLGAESMRLYPKNTMIIVGRSGILRHTLPVSILKQEATINQDLKALVFLNGDFVEYIYIAIKGMEQDLLHCYKKAGTTVDNLNFDEFLTAGIPIPPLAEQQRIVTAIENAFAEITEIENNQELLKKHIKQGRQKILDLAIRGKLTQQLKTDGTTKDLLKQISSNVILSNAKNPAETVKSSRVILSKRSASKDLAKEIIPLDKTTAPFEIPDNWEWVRLGDYLDVRDGTHDSPKYVEVGYPFVTSKNLVNGTIDFSTCKQVSKDDYDKFNERSCVEDGDILYAMIGSIGNAVLVKKDRDFAIKNVALFKKRFSQTDMNYVYYWLYFVEKSLKENAAGGLQPFISLSMFRDNSFPLPPLAEQQRIVAIIEQIFAEFDAMEINL